MRAPRSPARFSPQRRLGRAGAAGSPGWGVGRAGVPAGCGPRGRPSGCRGGCSVCRLRFRCARPGGEARPAQALRPHRPLPCLARSAGAAPAVPLAGPSSPRSPRRVLGLARSGGTRERGLPLGRRPSLQRSSLDRSGSTLKFLVLILFSPLPPPHAPPEQAAVCLRRTHCPWGPDQPVFRPELCSRDWQVLLPLSSLVEVKHSCSASLQTWWMSAGTEQPCPCRADRAQRLHV